MTHFNTRIMAVASVALLGMTAWVCAEAGPGKKLIEYGWDARSPAYVVEHIREMEKRPFDGIVVQTAPNSFSDIFYNKELDDEQTAASGPRSSQAANGQHQRNSPGCSNCKAGT